MNDKIRNSKENLIFMLLTFCGMLLRLIYVIRIPYYVNQHDAGDFSAGHIGYICYLVEHNWHLPDVNPTTVWSFYHPPLHHYLAAVVAKISLLFGTDMAQAMENVQFLTVLYGALTLLISYKLLKKFKLKGLSLLLPYGILAFHPSLIMLSGSINNDGLCLLLMFTTAYLAILWYEKPDWRRIIVLALSLAATVLTKISGLLLAPAIAVLFLLKLWKERTAWKKWFMQFILFGVICIPLALSFSIRNLILWHVNPFFTLDLGEYMYTGNNLLERLFLIHKEQLASPFVVYNVTPSNGLAVDRNIILYLLKTSLFGDKFFLTADSPYLGLAWALQLVNVLLIGISFVCMIIEVFRLLFAAIREKSIYPYIKEFFLCLIYASSVGSYAMFCFKYPNCCSQDFRYIYPTLLINAVFWGLYLKRTLGETPENASVKEGFCRKLFVGFLLVLAILFAVFTSILFFHCSTK